jgi:hypothetical protein
MIGYHLPPHGIWIGQGIGHELFSCRHPIFLVFAAHHDFDRVIQ